MSSNSPFSNSTSPSLLHEALAMENFDNFIQSQLNISSVNVENDEIPKLNEKINFLEQSVMKIFLDHKKNLTEIQNLKDELNDAWENVYYIERDLNQLQQYSCRENVEICGIPDVVGHDDLEVTVIKIGVKDLEHYEIAACHRLKKVNKNQPANVIVRFTNRKRVYQCLKNRKHLRQAIPKYPNIYIIENLCPKYRSIFDTCSKLRREGKIKSLWSYNGTVQFKTTDDKNERSNKIFHFSDLEEHFPNLWAYN